MKLRKKQRVNSENEPAASQKQHKKFPECAWVSHTWSKKKKQKYADYKSVQNCEYMFSLQLLPIYYLWILHQIGFLHS